MRAVNRYGWCKYKTDALVVLEDFDVLMDSVGTVAYFFKFYCTIKWYKRFLYTHSYSMLLQSFSRNVRFINTAKEIPFFIAGNSRRKTTKTVNFLIHYTCYE